MTYRVFPSPSTGYYQGGSGPEGPFWKGQGSNMGQSSYGLGMLSQGQGNPGSSGWDPSIVYLLVLVIAEMFIFAFLGRVLR